MTLIISASVGRHMYQVSDRQVTDIARGELWDATWNKTVVVLASDTIVSLSFSGVAFVKGRPTDEWAVGQMRRVDTSHGSIIVQAPAAPLRLSVMLGRLLKAVNRNIVENSLDAQTFPFHAALVGYRNRGRRLRPVLIRLSNLLPGETTLVRPTEHQRRSGANPARVLTDPPGWVSVGRGSRLISELTSAVSPRAVEDVMVSLLREISKTGAPIGPDAMCVRIDRDRPLGPSVRFDAVTPPWLTEKSATGGLARVPAFHTPAIITPGVIQLASQGTGASFDSIGGLDIEWDLPATHLPGTTRVSIGRQPRRKPE